MTHDTLDPDDLARLIDASFGDGPRHPHDVTDLLGSGRRAVRRRRGGAAAAAVAAVAAVGISTAVLTGGGDPRAATDVPAATRPSAVPTTSGGTGPVEVAAAPVTTAASAGTANPLDPDNLVTYGEDGRLYVYPEATVEKWVHDPFEVASYTVSDALAVSYRGEVTWFAMYRSPSGGGAVAAPAEPGTTFREFIRETEPGLTGVGSADENNTILVRFGDGDVLDPMSGVRILEQRPRPDLGDAFARPGERSAVAMVQTADDVFYVLARSVGGGHSQYIGVTRAEGGETLDDFLDLAASRYAEGGGGLL